MLTLGILESTTDNVLWYSSSNINRYMTLLKYAVSFASNIKDGRLEEISHTPGIIDDQKVDNPDRHIMFIKTQVYMEKNYEMMIHFCMDIAEHEISNKTLARGVLELFIEKFFDRVKLRKGFLEKVEKKNDEFTSICDRLFNEAVTSFELMTDDDVGFLLDHTDDGPKQMDLLFSAVSTQGLPIAANFYDEILTHFKLKVGDEENAESVLENLISAQLSTLLYQSLIQGTCCNYLLMKFTDIANFNERELAVNFIPVSKNGKTSMNIEDFAFIAMAEGDPEVVHVFQRSVTPMLADTNLLNEKFTGNVAKYKEIKRILETFPRTLELD